jgi:hypothetical protein
MAGNSANDTSRQNQKFQADQHPSSATVIKMKCLPVFGLVTLYISGLALAQTHTAEGAVTLEELQGAVAEGQVVHDKIIRRMGKQYVVRVQETFKLFFNKGRAIDWTQDETYYTSRGTHKGKTKNISRRLEKAGHGENLGGSQGVWIFGKGIVTNLRVFKSGGLKREIVFNRVKGGLLCSVTERYMREDGTGAVAFNSPVTGASVVVVSGKQISSSCTVRKQK